MAGVGKREYGVGRWESGVGAGNGVRKRKMITNVRRKRSGVVVYRHPAENEIAFQLFNYREISL